MLKEFSVSSYIFLWHESEDINKTTTTRYSCVIAMTRTLPLPFFPGHLWPRNRRSDEEVTMETFACLPKDYMLTPLVWQFDVVWNLTFMMWHIWPFDPLNDLRSWWKKIHMYNGKMHCSKSSKKFLLSLVMEIKNYKAKTGNDPCDPIWPLINLRSTTAI